MSVATVTSGRAPVRRRPSGEPPALVREARWTRWITVLAAVVLAGLALGSLARATGTIDAVDRAALSWLAPFRAGAVADIARALGFITSFGLILALRWLAVLVLLVQRRTRHAVVFVTTFAVTDWAVARLLHVDLATAAFPSRPVAALAVTLFGTVVAFTPRGAGRRSRLVVATGVLAAVALGRMYAATDSPIAMTYAIVLAAAVTALMFRWLAPEESFPIVDRRGTVDAHLDLGGRRRDAVVRAMSDQLGLTVVDVEPFGLDGSGGSSPLRMTLDDGTRLFGKIYSTGHERADRWYRIGRTILYGQLEDEVPVGSVRRLAAYEDYALRFLTDHGVRVAEPFGIVELTANHEYLVVTELFEGAAPLGASPVDVTVIDEGIELVRTLWDIGVAHRDIKPANLLVRDGHLQLVDVSNLQIRPSPWRQAVDLANMMLTLSLVTNSDFVYERAQRRFTPDEIAEAFAATEGLTVPTELQAKLDADGRPLLERFRSLAPTRQRISIQRWSLRRVALIAASWLAASAVVTLFVDSLRAGLL